MVKVVDVSYGGENGFNQAIELAADSLSNVKFVKEKKLLARYFGEISQDSGACAPCPLPSALCPLPSALYPLPSALRPLSPLSRFGCWVSALICDYVATD